MDGKEASCVNNGGHRFFIASGSRFFKLKINRILCRYRWRNSVAADVTVVHKM